MKNIILGIIIAYGMLFTSTFAADAGATQEVHSNDLVQLDGTNSTPDRGGEIVKYKWKQKKGHKPKVHLSDKKSATPTFIAPVVKETTELIFELETEESYDCKTKDDSSKEKCKKYKSKDRVSIFVHPEDDNQIEGYTVSGSITDINDGSAISGASVKIGTQTAITDASGIYTVMNVIAAERVSIDVTHSDYLANSRIANVNNQNVTMDIQLDKAKSTLTFDSLLGGTAEHDSAKVELPEGGYVDSNGIAYTGTITVKMSYYPITTQSGREAFPGTFEGIDGNDVFPIQSYGFMNVELTDTAGNPLNLAPGSTATLTYPIDTSLSYPATIPLWYYDTAQGYWVQDGEAVRTNYSHYIGTVTHFTSWNLDAKGPVAKLTGCVEDENGNPEANADVQFRSVNWDSYTVQTDASGSISVYNILAQTDLTFTATAKIGNAFYYGEYPTSIYLAEGEDRVLSDCVVMREQTNLPGTITVIGTMTEYNYDTGTYEPVANEIVNIFTREGRSGTVVASGTSNNDGTFSITFQTVDALVYIVGSSYYSGTSFTLQTNKSTYDVGTIILGGKDE